MKLGLPNARWIDSDLLVNWIRVIKSKAELNIMKQAGKIAEVAMKTAWEKVDVGVLLGDGQTLMALGLLHAQPDIGLGLALGGNKGLWPRLDVVAG